MTEFLLALVLQVFTKGTRLYFDTWNTRKMEQHLSAHYGKDYAKEKAEKEAARQEWEDLASGFGGLLLGGRVLHGWECVQESGRERCTGTNTACRQMYSQTPPYIHAAAAARGGAKTAVPYLQNLYTTRASAYGEALKQFVTGYREGLEQGAKPPPTDGATDKSP